MNKPIRVLHVLTAMKRAGAETMLMNLFRNIDRSKIQFDFAVSSNEKCDYDDEIMALRGRIYHYPKYTGYNHFAYKKWWDRFFSEHKEYRIIHGHVNSTAAIYLKTAKQHGLYAIAHSHTTSSGSGVSAIMKDLYQWPIRYIADFFMACSHEAGVWLFGQKVCGSNKFLVLRNAIDTSLFSYDENKRSNIRTQLNIDHNYVIGHVGRFVPEKNHAFIINVFRTYLKINSNAVLLLVGAGPLKEQIAASVRDIKDRVIFLGSRDDVYNWLLAMDVFLFPSLYEGLGIAVIEAQASGLPCVVSDKVPKAASCTDLVSFLPLSDDAGKWADALNNCAARQTHRRDYINEVKHAGYDVKQTAKELEEFYLKVGEQYE